MGHLIPAGTGFELHRRVRVKPLVEVPDEEPEPESSAPVDLTASLLAD